MIQIKIKKLTSDLPTPQYATSGSAGIDLYAAQGATILPRHQALIPTGIALELPAGYEAQVRSRSGLANKHGIFVLNGIGTIDSDYRGEVSVILANFSNQTFILPRGTRLAQMVFNKYEVADLIEVAELGVTERGEGGFGSTGA